MHGACSRVGEMLVTLVPIIGSGDVQTRATFVTPLFRRFFIVYVQMRTHWYTFNMCECRNFIEITFPERSHGNRALSELTSKPLPPLFLGSGCCASYNSQSNILYWNTWQTSLQREPNEDTLISAVTCLRLFHWIRQTYRLFQILHFLYCPLPSSGSAFWLVFGRCCIRISAGTPIF
jgi:hypothetical protein